jgi:hypothetical protein
MCVQSWELLESRNKIGIDLESNSRVHNIQKRFLVVSRRTTGLRVYGIVELFNTCMHPGTSILFYEYGDLGPSPEIVRLIVEISTQYCTNITEVLA